MRDTRGIRRGVAALLLAGAGVVAAADAPRPLFATDAPLTVTLQAPWPDILRDKADPRRHPATLVVTGSDGQPRSIATTVETRGITRRRVCRFPPLRLRFQKPAVAGSEFAGQDELKMVTHCDTAPKFADYYVLEALAYRMYNAMTDASFRVRPLEATYRDPAGGKPIGPRFAFLIEEVGDVARRAGLKRDKRARFRPGDFDAAAMSRLALFQYLLGNTDWDVTSGPEADSCCHNTRALVREGGGVVPVPYDFDSSGLVNAQYAAPHASLPIKDVRTRLFRGFCVHNDALPAARQEFLQKRQALLGLVQGEPRLDERRKKTAVAYLESFYATLDSDAEFAEKITAKCRK